MSIAVNGFTGNSLFVTFRQAALPKGSLLCTSWAYFIVYAAQFLNCSLSQNRLLSRKQAYLQHKSVFPSLFRNLLTTCLPTDSEKPAHRGISSVRRFVSLQPAFRLQRFLAWNVVIVRSCGVISSAGCGSVFAMPKSIFAAAFCRISSVTWE